MKNSKKIAIVGGGAGGFFTALRCALVAKQKNINATITIFEASTSFLRKVRISGGGRCNVTHHIFEPRELISNYPRGQRELLSPFMQFQAQDTVNWFEKRGISLKHEADGRMFPTTNSSETIINCFLKEAEKLKITLKTKQNVKSLKQLDNQQISLYINDDKSYVADAVMIATGSAPGGYRLAKNLGHTITDLAPSLFTFKIDHPLLKEMAGTSFEKSKFELRIDGSKKAFKQEGPALITHWGLSGPAVLKLSAWAAREMKATKHKAKLIVNWTATKNNNEAEEIILKLKTNYSKSKIANALPDKITKKFWLSILDFLKIDADKQWANLSKKETLSLSNLLHQTEFDILGKSRFKEEFVECGGINLKEINFKTMQSKICPNLYFSGEVMDIDGITGGFNFQNAWTSGWIAGNNMLTPSDLS